MAEDPGTPQVTVRGIAVSMFAAGMLADQFCYSLLRELGVPDIVCFLIFLFLVYGCIKIMDAVLPLVKK